MDTQTLEERFRRDFPLLTYKELADKHFPEIEDETRRHNKAQNYGRGLGLRKLRDRVMAPVPTGKILPPAGVTHFPRCAVSGRTLRFGFVSDQHLCSHFERLDVLEEAYRTFKAEGINLVFNAGNWIDGECRFNQYEIHTSGFDKQLDYCVQRYPNVPGIETWYVAGDDHEGWYQKKFGIEVGLRLQQDAEAAGRSDLRYLGYIEHDILLPNSDSSFLRVMHPGGGTALALSHTSQKIVNSLARCDVPAVLLIGHYHKAHYTPDYHGCHIIQGGCQQDQSGFMRKQNIIPHIGYWTVEAGIDGGGNLQWLCPRWYGGFSKGHTNGKFASIRR